MNSVCGAVFWSMFGGLLALPQQFVAIHGWPGLAALVAGGIFLTKLAGKDARTRAAIPVLAVVALVAWWFWPSAKPAPAQPGTARHGGTAGALAQHDAGGPEGPAGVLRQRKQAIARRPMPRPADRTPVPMPRMVPKAGAYMPAVPGVRAGFGRMPVLRPGAGHASPALAPRSTGGAGAPGPARPAGREVKTRQAQLNALCPVCGLAFRTRLSAQERTRCPRCNVPIGVGRARALYSLQAKGSDQWTD